MPLIILPVHMLGTMHVWFLEANCMSGFGPVLLFDYS